MLFLIRFTDRPDRLAIREKFRQDHLSWLANRRDKVLVAGSLRLEPGANPAGAVWIVELDSKQDAELLYQTDPFWVHGLRQSVEIWHWHKAFPDLQVLV